MIGKKTSMEGFTRENEEGLRWLFIVFYRVSSSVGSHIVMYSICGSRRRALAKHIPTSGWVEAAVGTFLLLLSRAQLVEMLKIQFVY